MSKDSPRRLASSEIKKRKREKIAITIVAAALATLTIVAYRLMTASTTLPFVNSIFFFGLLNVNIILLGTLVWLIFKNVGKVFFESRSNLLGARLKTKLIVAFLAFSITPTLILFVISSLYINTTFDKWFSIKVQNTLQASLDITRTYYKNADRTALHFAKHVSKILSQKLSPDSFSKGPIKSFNDPDAIDKLLASQRELLALDAVELYLDPLSERFVSQNPDPVSALFYPRFPVDLLFQAFDGEEVPTIHHFANGDLIRTAAPVYPAKGAFISPKLPQAIGVVVVNSFIPVSLVNKVDTIASVLDDYKETNPLQYPIKTAYFFILVMITLLMIFVAIWMGLYLSRELTDPVERLVKGAQEVGAGNLDFKIEQSGNDEISTLIASFNKMTQDLSHNRQKLTMASIDLENRRVQLEAILANIGTGVVSIDSEGFVSNFNRAASQLLQIDPVNVLGKKFNEIFVDYLTPLAELITRTNQNKKNQPEITQWNVVSGDSSKSLAAIATPLTDHAIDWGVVVVLDDMTHIMKAQREVAWREVARRIAHEIKNPLTPIKLSAQRLQRRLSHLSGKDGELIHECTDTIVKHTDELKVMVNEFSNFARFPEINPEPSDLNAALRDVIALFSQAHTQITFIVNTEPRLPMFSFDRSQMKRVFTNLLDNAVAALLKDDPTKKKWITAETHYNEKLELAVIMVSDTGAGMPSDVVANVFEPYFSTKSEGTGLGLAIAKRIVNDHNGFIRVQSQIGVGTQFWIEIPTATVNTDRDTKVFEPDFGKLPILTKPISPVTEKSPDPKEDS